MGDGCLSIVVVVTALFKVATGADSLLLAAEASSLMQLKRLVMTCNCEPFAVADTFEVALSSSFSLSLLLSSLFLSLLVNFEVASFVIVVCVLY